MANKCILKNSMPLMHSTEKAQKAFSLRFPICDLVLLKKWCDALRKYINIDHSSLHSAEICSLHFQANDFYSVNRSSRLIHSAVPSKFVTDHELPHTATYKPPARSAICKDLVIVLKDIAPLLDSPRIVPHNATYKPPARSAICKDLVIVIEDIAPLLDSPRSSEAPKNRPVALQQPNPSGNPCRTLPNFEVPFCRLCFNDSIPLEPLFPPASPSTGCRLVTLIQEVANITIDFEADCNGCVCHECRRLLEEMFKLLSSWKQKDRLLENARKKSISAGTVVVEEMPVERPIKSEGRDESNKCGTEGSILEAMTSINPTVLVEIPIDRLIEFEAKTTAKKPLKEKPKTKQSPTNTTTKVGINTTEQHEPKISSSDASIDNITLENSDDSDIELIQLCEPKQILVIDLVDNEAKQRLIRRERRELSRSLNTKSRQKRETRSSSQTPSKSLQTTKRPRSMYASFESGL